MPTINSLDPDPDLTLVNDCVMDNDLAIDRVIGQPSTLLPRRALPGVMRERLSTLQPRSASPETKHNEIYGYAVIRKRKDYEDKENNSPLKYIKQTVE